MMPKDPLTGWVISHFDNCTTNGVLDRTATSTEAFLKGISKVGDTVTYNFTTWNNTVEWKDCAEDVWEKVKTKIEKGRTYDLPDGSKLIVDSDGNYRIEDSDAKVTYKANNFRQFSPYLNASDLLLEFVKYAKELGIRDRDVLTLPINLFISWLLIEAAEKDNDPVPPEALCLPKELNKIKKPRCLWCQRFIRHSHQRHQFPFCSPEHANFRLKGKKHEAQPSCRRRHRDENSYPESSYRALQACPKTGSLQRIVSNIPAPR